MTGGGLIAEVGRCPDCGRFCTEFYDVWARRPNPEIDRSVCKNCAPTTRVPQEDQ